MVMAAMTPVQQLTVADATMSGTHSKGYSILIILQNDDDDGGDVFAESTTTVQLTNRTPDGIPEDKQHCRV